MMEILSMEALQCRKLSKSYAIFPKEKWLKFHIKTLAQHGFMPFRITNSSFNFATKPAWRTKKNWLSFTFITSL